MVTHYDLLIVAVVPLAISFGMAIVWSRLGKLSPASITIAVWLGFCAGKIALDVRDQWTIATTMSDSVWVRFWNSLWVALNHQLAPATGKDWLIPLGALSIVPYVTRRAAMRSRWLVVACLVVGAAVPLRLLWGSVYFGSVWTRTELIVKVIAIVIVLASSLFILVRQQKPTVGSAWLMPSLVTIALIAGGTMFLLTGSKTYGELGMVLAFAFAGTIFASRIMRQRIAMDDLSSMAVIFSGLMIMASAFSSTPIWQVLALASSLLASVLVMEYAPGKERARWRLAMQISAAALVIVPAALIVGWDVHQFLAATSSNPYSQYR